MLFSLNLIKKYVDVKLKPEALAELLLLKSVEIEKIEKKGGDTIMEVKILPNRGDLMSHFGLAREIAGLTGAKLKKQPVLPKLSGKGDAKVSVKIENENDCPRYCALVVEGITVKPSPKWLALALQSLGLRSINNIVDATNYTMLMTGQPMHAFDYSKIIISKKEGMPEIIVRHAKAGEKIRILDEAKSECELSPGTLVISDAKEALAIAGIKGGLTSGITNETKTIILESANFNKRLVRRASTRLGLRTDASIRFSYGLDPNLTLPAVLQLSGLITEVAGGKVASVTDIYPSPAVSWRVAMKKKHITSLLGVEIADKQTLAILNGLFLDTKLKNGVFEVTVPTWRLDIQTPEDVIEEVGRVYGYGNIPSRAPVAAAFDQSYDKHSDLWDYRGHHQTETLLQNIMKSMSFSECYNYSFVSDMAKDVFKLSDMPELLNPVSDEYHFMRPTLIPNLVIAAVKNLRFAKSVRLFEIGHAYRKIDEAISEYGQVAGVLAGQISSHDGFSEIKGVVESLLQQLGIDDAEFANGLSKEYSGKFSFHPGKAARIEINGKVIGVVGEMNPSISANLDLKSGTTCHIFSFNLDALYQTMEGELEYQPIPKYPSIIRDMSVLINDSVQFGQLLEAIQEADTTNLIQDVDVFDIYEPERAADKKSIAFHVVYRSDEKTLTDTEVDAVEENIRKALKEKYKAEIR